MAMTRSPHRTMGCQLFQMIKHLLLWILTSTQPNRDLYK